MSNSSIKRYLMFPDVQVPYHNKKLWKTFVQFVREYQPDKLFSAGDFSDSCQLSRWVRGTKGEYDGRLQDAFDTSFNMLSDIREVYDGPIEMVRSNHDDRLELYLEAKAPALEGLRDLTIERQLGLDKLNIKYTRGLVNLAPGWVLAHGDEGAMSSICGQTALKLAKKVGKSVACGHSHRGGLVAETVGYGGKTQTLHGMDLGNMMDMNQAKYLKTGGANWQSAVGGLLYVKGTFVQPHFIPATNGKFIVEGKTYGF